MSYEYPAHPIYPMPPAPPVPLEEHLALAPTQDPMQLGATGYADTVFTLRLAGPTN